MIKSNETIKWLKIAISLSAIVFAAAVCYANLKDNRVKIQEHDKRITIVEKASIERAVDIRYILESLKRIEGKLP